MQQTVIKSIITSAVNNLHDFGYPYVNEKNIFTDYVYCYSFHNILKDNLGKGFDEEILFLLEKTKQDIK